MTEDYRPPYPCDLHSHTTRSDGNDSPAQLIDEAARLGLYATAITDHDIPPPQTLRLDDGAEMDTVEYARRRGVVLMLGNEYSCDTDVDDVHIIGYGMDWSHAAVLAEVDAAKRSKSDGYRELCERLTERGMPVSWDDDILHFTKPDGTPGRRTPDEVQRKHIFEAIAAKGYTPTWSEAKLLVRDDPGLNVKRRKIDPLDAIGLIRRAGGVAVLAHPYLIDETVVKPGCPTMSRHDYILRLFEAGLVGIEARYTYDKTSYKGSLTPEQIESEVRAAYGEHARFFSGGSDYHADHRKGVQNARRLGERGLTVEEFEEAFADVRPK